MILRVLILGAGLAGMAVGSLAAGDEETLGMADPVQLPPYSVVGVESANRVPAWGVSAPATALRYAPSVDLQKRGPAEGQADLTIRGGTFENTGVKLGVAALFDPQTGHYSLELPIDPAMLGPGRVETGPDNAMGGFNSSVATVRWDWAPVREGFEVEGGVGSYGLNFQRFLGAVGGETGWGQGRRWQLQVGAARSEGRSAVREADHSLERFTGRVQLVGAGWQTDLVAAWQDKFLGWPGAYTGNRNFPETDHTQTALFLVQHRVEYGHGSEIAVAAYHRKLNDDYELDRHRPGFFRPYEHTTRVESLAVEGAHRWEAWAVRYRAHGLRDRIQSTELVHAGFMRQGLAKFSLAPEWSTEVGSGQLSLSAGLSYDWAERHRDALLPMAEIAWRVFRSGGYDRLAIRFDRTSQVPGYTAMGSNPAPGAFAGNPSLGREFSRNHEIGYEMSRGVWSARVGLFHRRDRDLVDWTYSSSAPRILRQANAVDLQTRGVEAFLLCDPGPRHRIALGYTAIGKSPDYRGAEVDASFYALNYARHRLTASWVFRPLPFVDLLFDTAVRRQADNRLRQSSRNAWVSSLGLSVRPPQWEGLEISVLVDNLSKSDFEEFPGTPAEARHLTLRARYVW